MNRRITFMTAALVVVLAGLMLGGCVDNGIVAPGNASIVLSANPATVVIDPDNQVPDPDTGRFEGTTSIDALVLDENSFPMEGVSVVFRSTAGTLDSSGAAIETNANGVASDTLTVSDLTPSPVTVTALSGNLEQTTTVTVVVASANAPPVARMTISPAGQAAINDLVTFDGTGSSDPDGVITCYQWEITSSNPDPMTPNPEITQGPSLASLARSYVNEQTLDVQLRVSDSAAAGALCVEGGAPVPGNLFSAPAVERYEIVCDNDAPVAVMLPSGFIDLPLPSGGGSAVLTMDGSASSDTETPVQLLEFHWSCGNSQTIVGQGQSAITCTYDTVGQYTVSMFVVDFGNPPGNLACRRMSNTENLFVSVDPAP